MFCIIASCRRHGNPVISYHKIRRKSRLDQSLYLLDRWIFLTVKPTSVVPKLWSQKIRTVCHLIQNGGGSGYDHRDSPGVELVKSQTVPFLALFDALRPQISATKEILCLSALIAFMTVLIARCEFPLPTRFFVMKDNEGNDCEITEE